MFAPVVIYLYQRKHIDTRFHFVRQYDDKKEIEPNYVKILDETVDIFMKPLKLTNFEDKEQTWHKEELKLEGNVFLCYGALILLVDN